MSIVIENYQSILAKINECRQQSLFDNDVCLLAVSKTVSIDKMQELYDVGVREFGESRPQEILRKAPLMAADCQWHMIGHLQKNKIRSIIKIISHIHSIDSIELLQRVNQISSEEGACPKILFEVNVSGEASKGGFTVEELGAVLPVAMLCESVVAVGLMTMAPFDADEKELHEIFGRLRKIRDDLEEKFQISLPELSMGMSGDYDIAISEGATIVRVGSSLFGER